MEVVHGLGVDIGEYSREQLGQLLVVTFETDAVPDSGTAARNAGSQAGSMILPACEACAVRAARSMPLNSSF
jgi:hypothetical protein